MKANEFKSTAADGAVIHVYEWLPENLQNIKGMVQIAHGMAEHGERYADFASFLTEKGYAVYANDHRGHGKTAGDLSKVGFLAPSQGWEKVVADFKQISQTILDKYPGKPLIVMGHSMGSFVVRTAILDSKVKIKGAIFSGTADDPGMLGKVGLLITKFLKLFYPANTPSPLMDNLSFGAFNKPFKPNRTKFDWLSRDNEQVDKYVEDPYCGSIFSLGFFNDMLRGLLWISKQENINNTPKDLPLLIFSGEQDPVGGSGMGVKAVFHKYKKAGVTDLTFRLFPEARHEMLNEINKDEVYQFIMNWLEKKLTN